MENHRPLLVLVSLLLWGCGGAGEEGVEQAQHSIHRIAAEDAVWTVGHESDATGGLEDVAQGAFLEPGVLAFGDGGSSQKLYIATEGSREVRQVGGPGDGPGEFRRLLWVAGEGADGLRAFDAGGPRVQRFSREGSFRESVMLPAVPGLQRVQAWIVLEGGHLLLGGTLEGSGLPTPGTPGLTDELGGLAWLPPGSAEVGEVFWEGVVSQWVSGTMGGRPIAGGHPWSPGLRVCALPQMVAVTTRETPEVTLFSPDGEQLGEIRWEQPRVPLTPDFVEAWAQEVLATAEAAMAGPFLDFIRSAELPEFVPAIQEIRCDQEGRVWVHEFPPPETEVNRWRVFRAHEGVLEAEKVLEAEVLLPPDVSLLAVGADHLAAVHRDALDVQRVLWLPNPL
ncbi:MAG: hypothetical protein WEA09_03650 [Gemmatimonadota bacterium]